MNNKNSRLTDISNQNFNQRLDVDLKRRARSDFDAENKNLSDVRASYDKLLLEHSRLKSESQTLDRQNRDAKSDLQSVSERKYMREGSAERQLNASYGSFKREELGSEGRFGSGRK